MSTVKEETETENESLTLTMTIKPDPLRQLLQCLNRAATTAQVFSITEDVVYLSYSTIMSKVSVKLDAEDRHCICSLQSCVIEEDDDDGGAEEVKTFQVKGFLHDHHWRAFLIHGILIVQEQEMEKQKLLYEQNRLANRGAAETVLLYISASKGKLMRQHYDVLIRSSTRWKQWNAPTNLTAGHLLIAWW